MFRRQISGQHQQIRKEVIKMIITPETTIYRVEAIYITGQSVSGPHKALKEAEKRMNEIISSREVSTVSIVRHHWTEWRKGEAYKHDKTELKRWNHQLQKQ